MFKVFANQLWLKNRLTAEILDLTFSEKLWNGWDWCKHFLIWASNRSFSNDSDLLLPPQKPSKLTQKDKWIYHLHTAKEIREIQFPSLKFMLAPLNQMACLNSQKLVLHSILRDWSWRTWTSFCNHLWEIPTLKKIKKDSSQVKLSQDVSKRQYHPQIVNLRKYHPVYAPLGRSQHGCCLYYNDDFIVCQNMPNYIL